MCNKFQIVRQAHGPRAATSLSSISVVMPERTDAGVSSLSVLCRADEGVVVTVDGKHKTITMDRFAAAIADLVDRPEPDAEAPEVVTSHDADELYAARLKAAEQRYRASNQVNYHVVFDEEFPWELEHKAEGPAMARKVYTRCRGLAQSNLSVYRVRFKPGSSFIVSARFE